MNITSLGSQELYRTLFGHNPELVLNEDYEKEFTDANQAIDENRRFDRLIIQNNENSHYTELDTSSVTAMFESGNSKLIKFATFVYQFTPDDKKFTEYFGKIGARLDDAYAEGKFTEDEYNELNAGLNDLIINMKNKCDESRARGEWIRSGGSGMAFEEAFGEKYDAEDDSLALLSAEEKQRKQMEEYKEKQRQGIMAFLNKPNFCTPIEKIMEMIQSYRTAHASKSVSV
jgi:hypothetical protein